MSTRLYLLDEPHVWTGEGRLELTAARPTYLLIYLACQGEWVSRESLAGLLWPDSPEEEARHNLRVNLHRAKNLGWAEGMEVERERVRLAMDTDVAQFRAALGQADWGAAVRLHRRPFLHGFPLQDLPILEEWAGLERQALLEAWQNAAQRYAEQLQQGGKHGEASALLAELLRHDLLAEDVLQNYLRAAYLAGQREAALKTYERFAQELHQELGLEPMQATQELAQTLRRSLPLAGVGQKKQSTIPLEVLRPPRLVGRETEQARLRAATLALVSGEPGVGKTRLVLEVFPQAVMVRCREGLDNLPFYPVLEHLKTRLGKLPDLGPYREDLARLLPEIWPGQALPPADPLGARGRLLEALHRALAGEEPLLFDDLQWADPGTLELLLYLRDRGRRLVGTYRGQEVGPVLLKAIEALRSGGVEEIRLEPLEGEVLRRLLADLIGSDEGPQLFSRWLYSKTGGNPFFALETLKALFEGGVLKAQGGAWHTALDEITQDYSELQVPPKVAEVVHRRVGRLSEAAQRVVQAASVVGENFSPKLLAGISGLSEWAVLDGMEEAERAGMIAGARFVHDVLRQGVYQELPQVRCRALHTKVAEQIEAEDQPQLQAEHWYKAGELQRAVALWKKAAQHLSDLGLHHEAIGILQRALVYSDPAQQAYLRATLAEQYHQVAEYQKASELIEQTLNQTSDGIVRAKLWAIQLHVLSDLGRMEQCAQIVEQHLAHADTLEDPRVRLEVRWAIATVYGGLGRSKEALDIIQTDIKALEEAGPSVTLSDYLSSLGSVYDHLEQHQTALDYHQRAYQMAKALNARNMQVIAVQNLLFCLGALGRSEEGVGPAEEALSLGQFARSDILRNNLGATLQRLGRYQASLKHYQYLAAQAREPIWRAVAHARLAEAWAHLGQTEAIVPALECALEGLAQTDHPFALALVASRVLRYGNDSQIGRIRPVLARINPEALNPMVRAQLEQAQAEYADRTR